MIKVVIADDERRVCQLIFDLIHWEEYEMDVIGMAYNGTEALALIEEKKPDIVITDIKMPGCSGLEMIQRAKKIKEDMEFVIISGYKFFEYAQQAIKFGVSEYLLKPIKAQELSAVLRKLQEKFREQQASVTEKEGLKKQIRENFLLEYIRKGKIAETGLNLQEINETYCLHFRMTRFAILAVRIDFDYEEGYCQGIGLILSKIKEIMVRVMHEICCEEECCIHANSVWCICNFEASDESKFLKKVKKMFEEIAAQKTMFPELDFTCGVGRTVREMNELDGSLRTAQAAVNERLVRGTGRVIDRVNPADSELQFDEFMQEIRTRLLLLDESGIKEYIKHFERELPQEISGDLLYKLVRESGRFFAENLGKDQSGRSIMEKFEKEFDVRTACCSSRRKIFSCLADMMAECISEIARHKKAEGKKPIRIAKNYIEKNYMYSISLEEMGELTGFNASYFSHIFKKETGKNFGEYIIKVRVDKAKDLLKETNITIAAVSEQVGYSDVKYFTKIFKKETGLKPGEYRKLYA